MLGNGGVRLGALQCAKQPEIIFVSTDTRNASLSSSIRKCRGSPRGRGKGSLCRLQAVRKQRGHGHRLKPAIAQSAHAWRALLLLRAPILRKQWASQEQWKQDAVSVPEPPAHAVRALPDRVRFVRYEAKTVLHCSCERRSGSGVSGGLMDLSEARNHLLTPSPSLPELSGPILQTTPASPVATEMSESLARVTGASSLFLFSAIHLHDNFTPHRPTCTCIRHGINVSWQEHKAYVHKMGLEVCSYSRRRMNQPFLLHSDIASCFPSFGSLRMQPEQDEAGNFVGYDKSTRHPLDDPSHPLYNAVSRDSNGNVRVDTDPF